MRHADKDIKVYFSVLQLTEERGELALTIVGLLPTYLQLHYVSYVD